MSLIVPMSGEEILTCRLIGNMRTISSRANVVKDMQMGNQPMHQTDEDGAIGEYAFCKHHNIFFDPSIAVRSGSYDCLLKGFRIDIKTTRRDTGRLIATTKINADIDIFALAIIRENEVYFPGWVKASELYKEENILDLGYGKTYALDQSKLKPWKETEGNNVKQAK
jgi:hypothetical protein